jgi:hypothetical protein
MTVRANRPVSAGSPNEKESIHGQSSPVPHRPSRDGRRAERLPPRRPVSARQGNHAAGLAQRHRQSAVVQGVQLAAGLAEGQLPMGVFGLTGTADLAVAAKFTHGKFPLYAEGTEALAVVLVEADCWLSAHTSPQRAAIDRGTAVERAGSVSCSTAPTQQIRVPSQPPSAPRGRLANVPQIQPIPNNQAKPAAKTRKPTRGLEPRTPSLRVKCSTS